MAFPTTGILDNFNRADEGPPPSASWTNDGANGWKVVSNQCTTDTLVPDTYAQSYWGDGHSTNLFGPDSEVYCTIVTKPATNGAFQLFIRYSSSTGNGYLVSLTPQAGTDVVQIFRQDSFANTQLGSNISQEFSANDSLGISCVGSTITAWYKASGGSWASIGSVTDSTYNIAGSLSIMAANALAVNTVIDNFGGGDVVTAPYWPQRTGFWGGNNPSRS